MSRLAPFAAAGPAPRRPFRPPPTGGGTIPHSASRPAGGRGEPSRPRPHGRLRSSPPERSRHARRSTAARPAPASSSSTPATSRSRRVTLDGEKAAAEFRLGETSHVLGRSLTIPIGAGSRTVHIDYRTQPGRGRVAVARAGADGGRPAAVPLHPVAGDPRAHLGAVPGLAGRAHHLRRRPSASRPTCWR